jgi:hypothetical protein
MSCTWMRKRRGAPASSVIVVACNATQIGAPLAC